MSADWHANTSQVIVENEDGDVVKTYELPSDKPESDLVSQSLKYMGMGGFIKPGEKSGSTASQEGEAGKAPGSSSGIPSWATGALRRTGDPVQKARKKSVAEEQDEDDRHIRFTIGGVGRRLTKEDFIQEMRKLDKGTRGEVVDQSSASHTVKTLAKQDAPARQRAQSSADSTPQDKNASAAQEEPSSSDPNSGSSSRSESSHGGKAITRTMLSNEASETPAERRRRLAALKGVGDGTTDEADETAAERRRREAALGVSSTAEGEEDSDDDDTPRVPPPRRGIRFAETVERR